jgi:purine catabolism regulator
VRQLTEIPYLRTWIHAGAGGADRLICWAHSIEMPRPWEWLEEGDLLMTVGLGIPAGAEAQAEFIERLARAELSGIAIGENMQAPALTDAMLQAAETHRLPILITAFEIPFIQLSRAVAGASHDREHRRLVDAARVYDRARADLARGAGAAELLHGLGEELECRMWVCANDSGLPVFPDADRPPDPVRDAFLGAVEERRGVLPGVMRLELSDGSVTVVPVPARRPCAVLVTPREGASPPPYALLQHAATVVALEAERAWAVVEERRRLGSETLASMLDGRMDPVTAARQAAVHDLSAGPYALLAVAREEGWTASGWLHHALADRAIANMLLRRDGFLYCLIPGDQVTVDTVTALFDDAVRAGVSEPFDELDTVTAALREARWALDAAGEERGRIVRYSQHQPSLLGARSITEAQVLVDQVLGPLLAYDAEHGTDLVASLAAFLACNRSWQRASAQLFVHKQTLVYRMQRVEALTGRKLNETSAVVELWLAVQALQLIRD